ncbi:MAG: hypothetical protein K0R44_825 [Thermomicrobiales bacterium]|nr:hypothetical protein [Thermomicrobiales bacterium]
MTKSELSDELPNGIQIDSGERADSLDRLTRTI